MKLLQSCAVAFAMYSRIPMPRVDWNEENMRYSMCFFPLVGAAGGGLLLVLYALCRALPVRPALFAVLAALLPLLWTGGIHLDGFCDTVDALASHQDAARRLEILKDPHIGAFGAMGCAAYLLLACALWLQVVTAPGFGWRGAGALALGYLLSRSLSGLSVVCFRAAKRTGTLAAFATAAQKRAARAALAAYILLCGAGMCLLAPAQGAAMLLAALLAFGCYRRVACRRFGGTTGDLAGWFLSLCELLMLAAAAVTGVIV